MGWGRERRCSFRILSKSRTLNQSFVRGWLVVPFMRGVKSPIPKKPIERVWQLASQMDLERSLPETTGMACPCSVAMRILMRILILSLTAVRSVGKSTTLLSAEQGVICASHFPDCPLKSRAVNKLAARRLPKSVMLPLSYAPPSSDCQTAIWTMGYDMLSSIIPANQLAMFICQIQTLSHNESSLFNPHSHIARYLRRSLSSSSCSQRATFGTNNKNLSIDRS